MTAALPPPALVADLGCGTVRDVAALRARGYRVVGLDRSPAMLAEAPAAERHCLAVADLRALPLAGGGLDGAVAIASLVHLRKSEFSGALAELRRVLRPGGVALISLKPGLGEEVETAAYGRPRFYAYYGAEELRGHLAASALTVIDLVAGGKWLTAIAARPRA